MVSTDWRLKVKELALQMFALFKRESIEWRRMNDISPWKAKVFLVNDKGNDDNIIDYGAILHILHIDLKSAI